MRESEDFGPEVERGVADFIRFRDEHLTPRLPVPPLPWQDLSTGFARAQAAPRFSPARPRRWFFGPAGLAAVAGIAAMTFVVTGRREIPAAPPVQPAPRGAPGIARPAPVPAQVAPAAPPAASPKQESVRRDPNLEVRIFAALHTAGADLGDPVEIQFDRGRWKVVALALDPAGATRLREALAPLPAVQFVLETGRLPAGDIAPPAKRPESVVLPPLIFASQLESYFGSRAALMSAADRALDHSQSLLSRAHALHHIEERFPVSVETILGSEERRLLEGMRHDHLRAAGSVRTGVAADFWVLADALGISAPAASPARVSLLDAAARWDHVLGIVLGGAATDSSAAKLKLDVSTAYADLERDLEDLP